MDELVQHCLRELSFEGDLGCNVIRLRDFIIEFYTHHDIPQAVDDAFCSFVWSLISQQPTVRVGTLPQGVSTEIWVAPQTSARRKAIAKGQQHVETKPSELVLVVDAQSRTLQGLKQEYGDRLRIAVHPDAIYAAITGSHIRFAKMSPMVYSALQIITKGREEGVTVVDLGQQSKYDQKTCFYVVRQLLDLDLVVKVRRGGVGTHFVIHKYFFERSPCWKAIRDEENLARDSECNHQFVMIQTTEAMAEDEDGDLNTPTPEFSSIDSRHLSSFPLICGRVVKLLKASKNQMHASQNMLITLGFSNPTKTDRRFFQSRIREMIQQGIIEKVVVPSSKRGLNASVKCFRLVASNLCEKLDNDVIVTRLQVEDDEKDVDQSSVKINITIHKQVLDLLEEAGTNGMTLNELSAALSQFDKRTIELFLARAEKFPPPSHLSDLGISGLMETRGRERRHRYFTIAGYHELMQKENLDSSSVYPVLNINNLAGYLPISSDLFFDDEDMLYKYQDSFTLTEHSVKRGRPRKNAADDDLNKVKKRRLKAKEDDDIELAYSSEGDRPRKRGKKQDQGIGEEKIPKKRGRPPKKKLLLERTPARSKCTSPSGLILEADSTVAKEVVNSEKTSVFTAQHVLDGRPHESTYVDIADQPRIKDMPHSVQKPPAMSTAVYQDKRSTAVDSAMQGYLGESQPPVGAVLASLAKSCEGNDVNCYAMTHHMPIDPSLLTEESVIAERCPPPSSGCDTNQNAEAFGIGVNMANASEDTPSFPSNKIRDGRVNVSHLRRENEFYRVVQNMGGVVNIHTKDFFDSHASLMDKMAKSGEPTSGPAGTRTDKRTAISTFESLERRGRVKQLKTTIVTNTGIRRPACIVYLPTIDQERLNIFLAELSRSHVIPHPGNFVKLEERLEYGADPNSMARSALPLQLLQMEEPGDDRKERWSKNIARARQLFSYEDPVVREVLLTERTTVAQLYGFIVGKALRARELHVSTMSAFEERKPSDYIVSHEQRIVDLTFFGHDITVGLYCSLVSSLSYNDELSQFMAAEQGRMTLVKDLPASLKFSLQIGRSRARSRVLDLLETLRALNLVTPLQVSSCDQPFITCSPAEGCPNTFDLAPLDGWTTSTPMAAPIYWLFKDSAPIHVWATSETSPPFWKNVSLASTTDVVIFWKLLEQASLLPQDIISTESKSFASPSIPAINAVRSLRRHASWNSDYCLTWHQMQYMKQFIDSNAAGTPLQDDDGGEMRVERISWIISAPEASVRSFFNNIREKLLKDMDRLQKKLKRASSTKRMKRKNKSKESPAKKATKAQSEREETWTALLERLHPAPLQGVAAARLDRICGRFLEADSIEDLSKWEAEISEALGDVDIPAHTLLKTSIKQTFAAKSIPVPVDLHSSATVIEKSVEELVTIQGSPNIHHQEKTRGKRKKDVSKDVHVPGKRTSRRHRFQWNRDYDELARDASVIIRARCRNLTRLDWTAFEQVFPAIPRNTVRQRLAHIKEAPGNETYLVRLEDRWYDLWMQHRGTPYLPDDDPNSTSNFNLIAHIGFLRRYIDKNAIRVGFAQPRENDRITIPSSVDDLERQYIILENIPSAPPWDFVWNTTVEEGREKRMLRQPLLSTITNDYVPPFIPVSPEHILLAESVVKMTLGTPHERYDPELGAELLHSFGEQNVSAATKNLLNRGVLSKLVRDPEKQKPGRQLKISEGNQNAIGGPLPRDTFQDALALEDMSLQAEVWREWPLLATDGDCAALVQLVSEDKLEFKIDTIQARLARAALDWNSKKADDDQIETTVHIRSAAIEGPSLPSSENSNASSPNFVISDLPVDSLSLGGPMNCPLDHGQCLDGGPACCRLRNISGLIDCTACLEGEWVEFNDSLIPEERDHARDVLNVVRKAGKQGAGKAYLLTELTATMTYRQLFSVVKKMTESAIPLLFWTGYSTVVLVSSAFLKHWTVAVSRNPMTRIFPRRWIDITASKVTDFWDAALKAVLGVVIFRPGITQAELRWRLRSVYDRQEIYDILRWLWDGGYLKVRSYQAIEEDVIDVSSDQEERALFWFLGDERRWYHA